MRLGEAFLFVRSSARSRVPVVGGRSAGFCHVKVLDSRGQPMTSLTAKDFIIAEDGVEQQVSSFTSIDTPYNILFFDRSGSTEELWTTMQRSADRLSGISVRRIVWRSRLSMRSNDAFRLE